MWAWRFLIASIAFTVISITAFFLDPRHHEGRDPYAHEDLAVIRNDPLMNLRSLGLTLKYENEQPGYYGGILADSWPTSFFRSFDSTQEPAETLSSVKEAGEESGWIVVRQECFPMVHHAMFTAEKNFDGFHARARIVAGFPEEGTDHAASWVQIEGETTHRNRRIRREGPMADLACPESFRNEVVDPVTRQS